MLTAALAVALIAPSGVDGLARPVDIKLSRGKPVVVAVVDDGVRTDHDDLRGLLWSNPGEVPLNGVDDDGNGRVDDVAGWDVADGDPDPNPPATRRAEYYHGTYVAGLVAQVARRVHGDAAPEALRIMPVKAVSDRADRLYVEHGFEGIEYALDAGAQVIICAWGQVGLSPRRQAILDRAARMGVVIVGSAGNFGGDRAQYPAAHEAALAVAALDTRHRRLRSSNYGDFVDLSALGAGLSAAVATGTSDRAVHDGTSAAAAIVGAAAALLRRAHPEWGPTQVRAALQNTAAPLFEHNPDRAHLLGAGRLDLAAALSADLWARQIMWRRPQGHLPLRGGGEGVGFAVAPPGELRGIRFQLSTVQGKAGSATVAVYAGRSARARLVRKGPLKSFTAPVFVPGNRAYVRFEPGSARRRMRAHLSYASESVDVARKYCRGKVVLGAPGTLEDGSGEAAYSPGTDCKWLIKAPPGKAVRFTFDALDTEALTDKIYFFDGDGTHHAIMAVFSGPRRPPEFTTWRNEVLVWFVTNERIQRQGWRMRYRFVSASERSGAPDEHGGED